MPETTTRGIDPHKRPLISELRELAGFSQYQHDPSFPGCGEPGSEPGLERCEWVRRPAGGLFFVTPWGWLVPVDVPEDGRVPPIPNAKEAHFGGVRKCGCRRERSHTCGACGKPYWIEFHGMADGYCTYCYHHG